MTWHSTLSVALVTLGFCAPTLGQNLGSDFESSYQIVSLPPAPGVPSSIGGVAFKDGDPSRLLLVGDTLTASAAIYEISLTRDASGQITGWSGSAVQLASAPLADGGLCYGPGGVLLYGEWPTNRLGQIEPGSSAPDKVIDLTPLGVGASVGGVLITPTGFQGAAKLRLTSYDTGAWHTADLVPDGSGTFDVANVVVGPTLPALGGAAVGLESGAYISGGTPEFANDSVVVLDWNNLAMGAYEVDAMGSPIPSTQRLFLDDFQASGCAVDPLTGDLLFPEYNGLGVSLVRAIPGALGASYCGPAVANSTGLPGVLTASGSSLVADGDVTLTASSLPNNQFGYFLNSRFQGFIATPGTSQGNLCLGAMIGRFLGPGQVMSSGSNGMFSLALDLQNNPTPTGPVAVLPGEQWNFTCWYRDAGGASNFTQAVQIAFE